jgi:rhamnose utilization protein RhaD (predicted bifunctional aldolase and dehydrogenase)
VASTNASEKRAELIALSRDLGREDRKLAILGEGNTSAKVSDDTFLVKASGSQLGKLDEAGVVECRFAPLMAMLERNDLDDAAVDQALLDARVDANSRKPSVEAVFHAYLLSLPGMNYVAHTHPIAVNGILCSPRAADYATKRTFPDEIVCCGSESVLVPYTDPGLVLAKAIRQGVTDFIKRNDAPPRIILLTNHGLIAPAATAAGTMVATLMATKAAEIFTNAAAMGGPIFLSPENVARIEGRKDEHYRRKALNL